MKLSDLTLRCFAEAKDGYWQAFCIDLNLAAQGESASDAKHKLEGMIVGYIYDALAGEDKEHAEDLLNRPAPLSIRSRYWYYYALIRGAHITSKAIEIFKEPVPLQPTAHNGA